MIRVWASTRLSERAERKGQGTAQLRIRPRAPVPTSASARSSPFRRVGKVAAGMLAWPVLMLFVATATFFAFGALLSLVILRTVPSGVLLILIAVFSVLAAATSWLVARLVASRRAVRRVLGGAVALLVGAGTIWAFAAPDESLYLARTAAWGESDVWDYQKFPSRGINNAPPVFSFGQRPLPKLFETIEYEADGQVRTADFEEFLASSDTISFIVIKDDEILYEGYFNGYERDSIVTSFSTAKSVTSALVGIAIDEGYIGSVDDRMVTYLPEMKGRGFDELTINPYADEAASYMHTNMRKLALGLPASTEPVGAAFRYNQYHPLLLGLILERTTERPVSQYLQEKIWQPLGMEFPASWSLDSTKYGFEKMESGLNGRAIDFAKIGRLYLNNGNWNGRQIISEQWVRESTSPDPGDDRPWLSDPGWQEAGGYYKYMWWGMPRKDGGYDYAAMGHLGQRISVFPEDGVVIVRHGITDEGVDWDMVIKTIAETVK